MLYDILTVHDNLIIYLALYALFMVYGLISLVRSLVCFLKDKSPENRVSFKNNVLFYCVLLVSVVMFYFPMLDEYADYWRHIIFGVLPVVTTSILFFVFHYKEYVFFNNEEGKREHCEWRLVGVIGDWNTYTTKPLVIEYKGDDFESDIFDSFIFTLYFNEVSIDKLYANIPIDDYPNQDYIDYRPYKLEGMKEILHHVIKTPSFFEEMTRPIFDFKKVGEVLKDIKIEFEDRAKKNYGEIGIVEIGFKRYANDLDAQTSLYNTLII